MAEGISPNPLNKISQVYLDRIAKINSDPEIAQKEREKWQTEAKVDTGKSADEKATARNLRNTPPGADKDTDLKTFITRKPGESLDKARQRVRQGQHAARRGVKENFSDWRSDLREIVDEIEDKAEKKVDEKKNIKNKVVINPILTDAVEYMGGRLLEVKEIDDEKKKEQAVKKSEDEKEDNAAKADLTTDSDDEQKAEALKKKEQMLKKRIVRMKMMAVNQGAGDTIVASYDPLEDAVEYFYEEGINEEGIDLLIEEIGLDEFVDFVDGGAVYLNEERAARRATVRAKSYEKVKAEVDKADAARKASKKGEYAPSYAKKETDVTDYGDDKPAAKKAPAKKPVPKPVAKKPAPKPVAKKVEKAVAKVKPAQPKKPASKEGLRDKIKSAYKAGVKRHRKATQPVRVFHKGMKAGAKKTVKFAKDVKKAVVGERYDPMDDPDFDHDEAEKNRGVSGKNNPKGGKKLKDILKKVQEGKLTSVKATTYGMPPEERKAHIDAERKRQGVKPKPEKKIEEEVGISSTEKMEAARKEAKLKAKEDAAVKKKVKKEGFSDWRDELQEKDLNAAERRALPDKDFVFPGKGEGPEGKQRGAYPINDKKHARAALAMAAAHASPEKEAKVKAAVKKKFPGIQQEGVVRPKGQDSDKEVNKATRKAAFRPFENTKPPKLKVAEDKAFDNVVGKLRKKYGKDAVLTKDSPKPKAQLQPKAKPQKPLSADEKAEREIDAQYGGRANRLAGRGLGT